jgi:hypothetical protein
MAGHALEILLNLVAALTDFRVLDVKVWMFRLVELAGLGMILFPHALPDFSPLL